MLNGIREAIFENSANGMLVLDSSSSIIDYNKRASRLMKGIGYPSPSGRNFEELLSMLVEKHGGRRFETDGNIITIMEGETETHWEISRLPLVGVDGVDGCSYVEIKNVTPIMSLIHKLQDKAYFDHLTGLHNRHSFFRIVDELRGGGFLPLGIVAADVNHLKRVNDECGHAVGDLLLQAITRRLRENSPLRAVWARMGGDEFSALVPNSSEEEMSKMVRDIEAVCDEWDDERFRGAGLAIAYKMRTNGEESITELMHAADLDMYTHKKDRRKKQLERENHLAQENIMARTEGSGSKPQ